MTRVPPTPSPEPDARRPAPLQLVGLADEITTTGPWQEQRDHARLQSAGIPWLRSARLKYGPHVQVLDLSASGILFQSEQPLQVDDNTIIAITGPMGSVLVAATVRRCRTIMCGDMKRYEIACVFKRRLQLARIR